MKFNEYLIDENDSEGGWVDTHYFNDPKEAIGEVILGEEAKEIETLNHSSSPPDDDDGNDSECEDIENYMNDGLDDENDEASLCTLHACAKLTLSL